MTARAPQRARFSPRRLVRASPERARLDPLAHVALTRPQRSYFLELARFACWVDGNQLGKSYAHAYLVHRFVRNETPHLPRRFPGSPAKVLVIGESYEQMVPLMEKLWDLADKRTLDPKCGYEKGRGITGKPPRIVFISGPAAGAEIHFATYRAGTRRIQGGTYDLVVCDEPPPSEVIGEVMPRLFARHGYLRIGFTPQPGMYAQDYLIKAFETGTIRRHTYGVTEANLWREGWPAPLQTQAQIDAHARGLLPHERAMRMFGSLDPVILSRMVPDFDDTAHVRRLTLADVRGWTLVVAVDHGTTGRKQAAALVAVRGERTATPSIAVLAEHVSDGTTTPMEDARAIRAMLDAVGVRPGMVDAWFGDVPTEAKAGDEIVAKANDALRAALIRVYGQHIKPIEVPYKPRGSVDDTCRLLNTAAREGRFAVNTDCIATRRALLEWDGDPWHVRKDIMDAVRYAATQLLRIGGGGWLLPYG